MSRFGLAVLAVTLSAALTCGSSFGQSASGADPAKRAGVARKLNHKMLSCKAEANKKKLIFSARRAFMKDCLKG
jgi:psiF repeat